MRQVDMLFRSVLLLAATGALFFALRTPAVAIPPECSAFKACNYFGEQGYCDLEPDSEGFCECYTIDSGDEPVGSNCQEPGY